ncbi:MAG: hypothetical protein PHQ12_03525 [Chthoniobacteraceae bacterium]|nr:hypothetical protein [Chthoniobacteraceae bacterium]
MNQLEAFRIIDEQLTRDLKNGNAPGVLGVPFHRAHLVLKKTLEKRERAARKREREERLMKGES